MIGFSWPRWASSIIGARRSDVITATRIGRQGCASHNYSSIGVWAGVQCGAALLTPGVVLQFLALTPHGRVYWSPVNSTRSAEQRNAMKALCVVAASFGCALLSARALAQDPFSFSHGGTAVVGAERIVGLNVSSIDGAGFENADRTTVGVFGSPDPATPYEVPKLTFDYFVVNAISVGGGVIVASISPDEGESSTTMILSPRLGFGLPLWRGIGGWIRAGITYYDSTQQDFDISGIGLNLDAMLVLAPSEHFAFTIGPIVDLGLSGTASRADVSTDLKMSNFGASAGLATAF